MWPFVCAPGAVFDVHRRPSHAGNKHKAWGPVEKRYLRIHALGLRTKYPAGGFDRSILGRVRALHARSHGAQHLRLMVYCSRPPRVHSSSTPAYAQRQRLATPSATPLCWASAPTAAVKTTAGNSPTQDGHFSDAQLCRLHRSPLSGRLRLSCAQVTLLWSDAQPTHTRIPCIATRVGLPRSGRWTRHFHIIPSERTRFGIRDQQRSVCCMHANATACCSLAGHGACSPCQMQIHTCAHHLCTYAFAVQATPVIEGIDSFSYFYFPPFLIYIRTLCTLVLHVLYMHFYCTSLYFTSSRTLRTFDVFYCTLCTPPRANVLSCI